MTATCIITDGQVNKQTIERTNMNFCKVRTRIELLWINIYDSSYVMVDGFSNCGLPKNELNA